MQNDGVTIDLSSVETSKSDVSSKMCTVFQSEYSFEDLIRGAAKSCVVESGSNRKLQSGNSTDDDYAYGYGDDDYSAQNSTIPTSFDNPAQFVVTPLPQNQYLVFAGISELDLKKDFDRYFSFEPLVVETSNPSQEPTIKTSNPTGLPSGNPSGLPSKNPSSNPSHHPTAGELIMPTSNPTGIPSGQPSSQPTGIPSRTPFADPSAIPSYRPQAIPSFKPSRNPSNQPSQEPTQEKKQPSLRPSLGSENPTEIPTEEIRSSKPTNFPISAPPIPAPSFNTNQPSLLPSNQVGGRGGNNFSNLGPGETAGLAAAGLVVGGILIKAVVEGIRFVDRFLRGDKKAVPTDEKIGDVELEGRSSDDTIVVNREVYHLGAEDKGLQKVDSADSPKSSPKAQKYQQLVSRDKENSAQI